ncbi:DUF5627 domain-containing protein [Flavitalea sp. BT771]|uniref:DUF5627 domain-containing protein n=1 Tax=Flavitalea sp. BT771 TaxID=3063329 RepID=UPI0026E2DA75|nr:DUF5627 domain-containing protein [Flavitalea sp. BT771]MDO6430321.1 DUF5627 domain-containing protein [Flavitalea sp. BT771]MDV6219539.1 DUF5627 domain-containing protein [Flavitalea sp. BT771]
MKNIIFASGIILAIFSSCSNKHLTFPDYKYTTVYFAYQSPVRTLVLGDDNFDNSLDNQHKCTIMATMGGVYQNSRNVSIGVSVDTTLSQGLKFDGAGNDVVTMPPGYYTLPKDMKITIPSGSLMGGLEVQLTDAFFADPRSVANTFVIPLRMTSVVNADSILSGKSDLTSPDPRIAGNWATRPKNYILYAVKYINPWHGNYLRRGAEVLKDGGADTTITYHTAFVETDQLCSTSTLSMSMNSLPLNAKSRTNVNIPFQLLLTFDNNGKCSIANPASAAYSITGNGEFVKHGDSWGNQQRDVLHLKYTVDFGTSTHSFTDTLVMRDRGEKFETFTPVVK